MRSLRARLSVAFVVIAVLTTALNTTFVTVTSRTMFRQYVEQRPDQAANIPSVGTRPAGPSQQTAEPERHGRFGSRERLFQSRIREAIWGGTLVAAGVGVLVALWLARRIARPVTDLTRAARAIAAGNDAPTVPVSGRDEVADLGRAFNRMAVQLAQDAEQRRQLFAGITHELRTPLAVIQGQLEGMLDRVIEPTPDRIAGLHGQTLLLRRLITDLRDLSLAQAGQLRLHPETVDVAELVSEAVEAFAPSFHDRGISVELAAPKTLSVTADPDRLRQIVQNLVDNALRYTPRGGTVRITLRWENDGVRLAVADTGQGIGAGDLPHIFEHFYRTDQSRTRSSGGMGLGLAIVKSLVEAHHGRVTVESTPGAGSTFTVVLPMRLQEGA
ncbi:MAG TPA: HAMP domain-containing sensor histidine kinase [bacterium]|nr:HAMP domain-containing sensor histidine kinase [bacterium]